MAQIRRNPSMPRFLSTILALLCVSACFSARAQDDDARKTSILQAQQKLAKAQAAHDYNEQGSNLLLLGKLHSVPGEERQAMDAFTQALSLFRFRADRLDEAKALYGLAKVYAALGHKQLAMEDYNKALQIQKDIGDTAGQSQTLQSIAALRESSSLTSQLGGLSQFGGKKRPAQSTAAQAQQPDQTPSVPNDSSGQPGLPNTAAQAPPQAAQPDSSFPAAASAQPSSAEPETQSQSADSMPAAQSAVQGEAPPEPPNPPLAGQFDRSSERDRQRRQNDEPVVSASSSDRLSNSDPPGTGAPSSSANADRLSPEPTSLAQPVSSLPPVERYPNIEAPDTVSVSQEISVQVSLTSDQISPETRILSGNQKNGKLQLQMANGERQWTLTVNITAPGMEITRSGSNTAQITIDRDGDSTIAAFYMRALPLTPANADGKRDTRIFATLWHDNAFLARIVRPLTILGVAQPAPAPLAPSPSPAPPAPMAQARVSTSKMARPMASVPSPPHAPWTQVSLDPATRAPDLTIVENRVGDTLRLVFFATGSSAPVEADIPNPDQLHDWINSHFAQLASHSRAITPEPPTPAQVQIDQLHAYDHLNAFGAELYDRFAPAVFKALYADLLNRRSVESPLIVHIDTPIAIQIFSDDPSLPWELMRPTSQDGSIRMDFLGATDSIARWPISRRGSSRPPQSLTVQNSVVVAPTYRGAQTLAAANQELTTLKSIRGFTQVAGNYQSIRNLAGHPPQGIVHFAGHGQVSEDNGVPRFTILLEDSEIDPATWQALGSAAGATHPLFFFNACDVGESRQFMNDVDGWAPALLGNGASGYIGALWPVKDSTAALFASTFYALLDKSLAAGHSLNVASLLAKTRAQVFRQTGDATALAYVFYGDPKLELTAPPARQ